MNTTLTIKIDRGLRDDAKSIAKEIGVPLTVAVNAMMRQFVRDRRLVLEAECNFHSHTPNAETRRAILDAKNRKNIVSFSSIEKWRTSMKSGTK